MREYVWQCDQDRVALILPVTWKPVPLADGLRLDLPLPNEGTGHLELRLDRLRLTPDGTAYHQDACRRWAATAETWRVLRAVSSSGPMLVSLATGQRAGQVVPGAIITMAAQGVGRRVLLTAPNAALLGTVDLLTSRVVAQLLGAPYHRLPPAPLTTEQQHLMAELYGRPGAAIRAFVEARFVASSLLVPEWLDECQRYQARLQAIAEALLAVQPVAIRQRLKGTAVVCLPSEDFDAFTCQLPSGQALVVFTYRAMQALTFVAHQYSYCRERGQSTVDAGRAMDAFLTQLAGPTAAGGPLPVPQHIDLTNSAQVGRFEVVLRSTIGFVLFHELAHQYHGHTTGSTESSIEREAKVDDTATHWLNSLCEESKEYWAGGTLLATSYLAYLEAGGGKSQFGSHPFAVQRLEAAVKLLGNGDNFALRRDPWPRGPQPAMGYFTSQRFVPLNLDEAIGVQPGMVTYTDLDSGQTVVRPFGQPTPLFVHKGVLLDSKRPLAQWLPNLAAELLGSATTGTRAANLRRVTRFPVAQSEGLLGVVDFARADGSQGVAAIVARRADGVVWLHSAWLPSGPASQDDRAVSLLTEFLATCLVRLK
ncbi:MAG: hypothetical protein IT204_24275 [Fimbriimonadaceae bacterium]|nr:hypothetical protein [Fimbriimonadaceae bacterium]